DLRGALVAAGVLSYRVLLFERDPAGEFKPPKEYPQRAIVTASTHDLPTLAGWWEGRDIVVRAELGLFPKEETRAEQSAIRAQDRIRLLQALAREGLLPPGIDRDLIPAMTPELDAPGVSHIYCSPYLRARAESRHGYDIVNHRELNPEIGSREDFERFVDALAARGMSHIADIVPNHMAVMGRDNAWWMDVL